MADRRDEHPTNRKPALLKQLGWAALIAVVVIRWYRRGDFTGENLLVAATIGSGLLLLALGSWLFTKHGNHPATEKLGGALMLGCPLVMVVVIVGIFVSGAGQQYGAVPGWIPAVAAPVVAVGVGLWLWWRYRHDQKRPIGRGRARPRVLHVLDYPGARIEIDSRWPGRTRFRIPSPAPLPLQGPARLVPRSLRGGGKRLSRTFGDLVWTGRGSDDVARWAQAIEGPLRALWGWRDRYTLQATLTPFGLIIHMPLVAATANEEPFLVEQTRRIAAGLATIVGTASPEGVRFDRPRAEAGDCPTCYEPVGTSFTECDACGARQHPECATWAGGCARFACTGESSLEASARVL